MVVTTSSTAITTKVNSPTVGLSMVENKPRKKSVALGFKAFVIKPIRTARNGEIRLEEVGFLPYLTLKNSARIETNQH